MREERSAFSGPAFFSEELDFWGSVAGDVFIIEGGKVYMRGSIYGNLTVQNGGRVHIFGTIKGNLTVDKGAKAIHSGSLGGDAINMGGRMFIERGSTVNGRVKAKAGQTMVNGHEVGESSRKTY